MPQGPSCFTHDLIDEMLDYENKLIFNFTEEGYHDPNCKVANGQI